MKSQKHYENDEQLENYLAQLAKKGQLVDFITNTLEEADTIMPPKIEFNGVALQVPVGGGFADRSCYKTCLKESIKPGGVSYATCIKKCKPKTANLNINFIG